MWINFMNLCGGDVDEVIHGSEPRKTLHILCQPLGLNFVDIEIGKKKAWMIVVLSKSGPNPKLHFLDEEKGTLCYRYISGLISSGKDHTYEMIDSLEFEAL